MHTCIIKGALRYFSLLFLLLITNFAYADTQFSSDLTFKDAINQSLSMVEKATYKDIHVATANGVMTGELVSKTKDVIILKSKTGRMNLKTNKEVTVLTFIDLSKVELISINILE